MILGPKVPKAGQTQMSSVQNSTCHFMLELMDYDLAAGDNMGMGQNPGT